MIRLFAPAVALMQRLRLLPKFTLVSLMFVLPLLALSAALLGQLQESIGAAERERAGVSALRQIHQASLLAQRQRGNERLRLSGPAAAGKPDPAVLLAALAALPEQGLPQLAQVRERGRALAAAAGLRDSYARHTALIASLQQLAEATAAHSGLDHDADPAGARLARLYAHELPALAERLGDIGARGAAYIDTGLFDGDDEQRINTSVMVARDAIERAPLRLQPLFETTPALQPGAFGQAAAFLERTRNEVGNSVEQTSGRAYFDAALAAGARLHALGDTAAAALDGMLAQRAAAAARQRNLTFGAIAASFLLAAWLFAGLAIGFSGDLAHLNGAVQRAAAGDLSHPPKLGRA